MYPAQASPHALNLYSGDSISTKDLSGSKSWTSVVLPFTTGLKADSCRLKMAVGGNGSVARARAFLRNIKLRLVKYPAKRLGVDEVKGPERFSDD